MLWKGFCEMNGYWRYMLGKIPRPSPPSEKRILTSETKEAFEFKLMKWLNITDFLRDAIRSTTKHHWPNVPRWGHGASLWHVEAIWILISRQQIYRASASKSSCAYQLKPYPTLMALHSMRRIPWNETRSDSKKLVLPMCLTGCTPPGFLNSLSSQYDSFSYDAYKQSKKQHKPSVTRMRNMNPVLTPS